MDRSVQGRNRYCSLVNMITYFGSTAAVTAIGYVSVENKGLFYVDLCTRFLNLV
jgi:hypothetical protein